MSPRRAVFSLLFLVLVFGPCAARADRAAFLQGFDASGKHAASFPHDFPFFDMRDKPATLVFGPRQPWRLINFWAAWCAPCIKEMPSLKALQDRTAQSKTFQVVLVSSDMLPSADALRYMMNQKNLPPLDRALYIKDYAAWGRLNIDGLPTTFIVSPQGKIIYSLTGAGDWQSPDAMAFLRGILPSKTLP